MLAALYTVSAFVCCIYKTCEMSAVFFHPLLERSQYLLCPFLYMSAKQLRRAASNFLMSVCLSVRNEQPVPRRPDFHALL